MEKNIKGIIVSRKYTNGEINRAGNILRNNSLTDEAVKETIEIISDWRAAHSPYNEQLFNLLTKRGKKVDSKTVLVNRLKKIESIKLKLDINPKSQLSRMQDIGGCRAIVRDIKKATSLKNRMLKFTGKFIVIKENDYISIPKKTGYRGYHIVYEYKTKDDEYRILLEVQIRTKIQHAWATMVETVGLFTNQALKSNIGPEEWKNFFVLTSKLFEADEMNRKEGIKDIITDLKTINRKHHLIDQINGFGIYLDKYRESNSPYYLLVFNYETKNLTITSYSKDDLEEAVMDYKIAEESKIGQQSNAVLVSANNFEDIKTGYQNYFANTSMFLEEYKRILKEN